MDALTPLIPECVFGLDMEQNQVGQVHVDSADDAFKQANADELQRLIDKNEDLNTKRSTNTWVARYRTWAAERGLPINLVTIPPEDLDTYHLSAIIVILFRTAQDEYEPESLKVIQTALERHLRDSGCCYSILKDREFQKSRRVLNGKAIDLKQQGKARDL